MNALDSFAEEHRLIRQVLDAFEGYVGEVETRGPVAREDLKGFVSFFQNFAHLHHHDKEEALLLPALVLAGLDWNGEPLARIRTEHDQEQYLMRSLNHVAQQMEPWSTDDRLHFLSVAKTFIAFHRNHMRFEATEVYPHAARMSESECARLAHDVERFDDNARAVNDGFVELAKSLVGHYAPSHGAPRVGATPTH